ncbi:hypothetical protein NDI56_20940 [Haloarcula sp. S1CR25-12]|uniref:Halobacterial output domain-containing protein n=1 Tax=Haloarcula saliterrae TaxID=2950534 RepID=A0ABU2FJJ2_9EURY|nr:DUF6735 family protein [Haloarcula sp. S1CR25-12]MDS0261875.1 hypothetical protein [Haloarcula sp. S1CR25-12]
MSHSAIVAYANGDGTFDLHYSRNGAEQYQLKEVLDGYLEGEYEKTGSDMPPLLPTEVAEFAADQEGYEVIEHDLIKQDPFAEEVESAEIPFSLPDISAEVLFVVQNWRVDVFSIVPITSSLLPLLADSAEVKLYDCERLGIRPEEATADQQPASYSLSGSDFFDLQIYTEMPPSLYFPFCQYHLDIVQGINMETRAQKAGQSESPSTVLYHDGCVIEYSGTQPRQLIPWSAIFVEVWSGDSEAPSYPWTYDGNIPSPRDLANELRLELSMVLIEELRQDIATLRFDNPGVITGIQEYRSRELTRFSTTIESHYGEAISEEYSDFTPFMPLPLSEA